MKALIATITMAFCLGTFPSMSISAPATDGDRTELASNVGGAMVAAFRQDYPAAESLCATARAIAARSDADEFLLGGVEYCYAIIASAQKRNAQACAGYLRAENHFNKAVTAKPSFAQQFLDEVRVEIKELRCK
jgi:hypothetical protein